jgi:hypothetical protein
MKTGQISPSKNGAAVVPDDDNDLPNEAQKGWSVNQDGYVSLLLTDMADTDTPIIVAARSGVRYPDHVRRVMATGTTATGINAYW